MRPPRLLSELAGAVPGSSLRGDCTVLGITDDSRAVRRGWAFLATRGTRRDGHAFLGQALSAGAAAVVVDRPVDVGVDVATLHVPSVRVAAGPIAAEFFGRPSEQLSVVGVTGTNGKTTTCELVGACIDEAGWASGLIGTIETRIAKWHGPSTLTTPGAVELQRTLSSMVDAGVDALAMEVSSHALDQHRADAVDFDVAVFTNLTAEHLDYHGTVEQYWASKARLFEPERCRQAIICVDDEWGRRLASQCRVPVVTYSRHDDADVRVEVRSLGLLGTAVTLLGTDGPVRLFARTVGEITAGDVAGAYLAARAIGIPDDAARRGIERCTPPAGRFEVIDEGQAFLVVVDYAHTPDALAALVDTARSLLMDEGRVLLVVGARGGRDRFKRPQIGQVAGTTDMAVLTADSPGDEDPMSIIGQLSLGARLVPGADIRVEPDRRAAIDLAVTEARPGDAVLIVGRGHERTERVGALQIPLDDREVARHAIRRRRLQTA